MTKLYAGTEFQGPYSDTVYLKHQSGVYLIVDGSNHDKVVDVGSSGDVKSRIENHDRKNLWKKNARTLAYAVRYCIELQRLGIELKLRSELDPPVGMR